MVKNSSKPADWTLFRTKTCSRPLDSPNEASNSCTRALRQLDIAEAENAELRQTRRRMPASPPSSPPAAEATHPPPTHHLRRPTPRGSATDNTTFPRGRRGGAEGGGCVQGPHLVIPTPAQACPTRSTAKGPPVTGVPAFAQQRRCASTGCSSQPSAEPLERGSKVRWGPAT